MRTVAIAGVGLIGGSFALAIRKAGFEGRILGISSPNTLREALALGVIDEGLPLDRAVPQADLVYLAQPIGRILEMIPSLDALLREGALVTDAGSTKLAIAECARRHIHRGQFIGGHPMAGKETRGVAAADADLFTGRTYVLTPDSATELETEPVRRLIQWIGRIGARLTVISPSEHDRVVAYTSHLPQLASTAIASMLAQCPLPAKRLNAVSGPALLDSTRLALSDFDIWRDILDTNAAGIRQALSDYIAKLTLIRDLISTPEMKAEFEIAANFSINLRREAS